MNTCSATSRITFINGAKGILRYRGYPIEQLAQHSSFLEVSFLLLYGQLPDKQQLEYFQSRVMRHTYVHEDMKQMMKSFRYDAHPMGILISAVAAMSTLHPEANPSVIGQDVYNSESVRNKQIHRIIGNMPTIAAYAYRHRIGRPYVHPSEAKGISYTENFMYMLDKMSNSNYRPHPRLARALDILFILHADHELNCSTAAMRHMASSGVDVYSCISASAAALYGPRHGGANEAVVRMLEKIGTVDKIPEFIEKVKAKKVRLMGFGHRVYKNYDPRAKIIKEVADEVFQILGKEPLIEVAVAIEKIALSDPYFIERKLYPNVDFYSGLIYKAMGFPTDYFPVLFAIPRTVGWLAHWLEFLDDPENKIVRPFQVYLGSGVRDYVPMDQRTTSTSKNIVSEETAESRRRKAAQDLTAKL
jgi:citrate synthase